MGPWDAALSDITVDGTGGPLDVSRNAVLSPLEQKKRKHSFFEEVI